MINKTVKFYTRNRCHLCEMAKEILLDIKAEYSFDYKEYDIDESDELTEKYGLMIPVVEVNGEMVQYGHINKIDLIETLTEKN